MYFYFSRIENGIGEPSWDEYLTDDQVRNAILAKYPLTKFSLCLFHINKAIIRNIAKNHLSQYIRKCKTDLQLWTYEKFRQVLCIPFLPEDSMLPSFVKIEVKLITVLSKELNAFEFDNLKKLSMCLKQNIFFDEDKLAMI